MAQRGLSCRRCSASSPREQLPAGPSSRTEAGGTPQAPTSPVVPAPRPLSRPPPAPPGLPRPPPAPCDCVCSPGPRPARPGLALPLALGGLSVQPQPPSPPCRAASGGDADPSRRWEARRSSAAVSRPRCPRLSPGDVPEAFRVSARLSRPRLPAKRPQPHPRGETRGGSRPGSISFSAVVAGTVSHLREFSRDGTAVRPLQVSG